MISAVDPNNARTTQGITDITASVQTAELIISYKTASLILVIQIATTLQVHHQHTNYINRVQNTFNPVMARLIVQTIRVV